MDRGRRQLGGDPHGNQRLAFSRTDGKTWKTAGQRVSRRASRFTIHRGVGVFPKKRWGTFAGGSAGGATPISRRTAGSWVDRRLCPPARPHVVGHGPATTETWTTTAASQTEGVTAGRLTATAANTVVPTVGNRKPVNHRASMAAFLVTGLRQPAARRCWFAGSSAQDKGRAYCRFSFSFFFGQTGVPIPREQSDSGRFSCMATRTQDGRLVTTAKPSILFGWAKLAANPQPRKHG